MKTFVNTIRWIFGTPFIVLIIGVAYPITFLFSGVDSANETCLELIKEFKEGFIK